jgi:hypothetical protein
MLTNGRKVHDDENDLEGVGQTTIVVINIYTTYQPSWGATEGFRENVQNFYDNNQLFIRSN